MWEYLKITVNSTWCTLDVNSFYYCCTDLEERRKGCDWHTDLRVTNIQIITEAVGVCSVDWRYNTDWVNYWKVEKKKGVDKRAWEEAGRV